MLESGPALECRSASSSWTIVVGSRRPLEPSECQRLCFRSVWPESLGVFKLAVDNVNTFLVGLRLTAFELGRIPHVFAGPQCFQGLEDSSSPTSGTAFPQIRGGFGVFGVCTLYTRCAGGART
jgi:hypothetical protein